MIEWGRFGPRLHYHAFTKTNKSVEAVRHAVAIDEAAYHVSPPALAGWLAVFGPSGSTKAARGRRMFRSSGSLACSGDVGGGAPEEKSQLAKIPLNWMIKETAALGLGYDARTVDKIVLGKDRSERYVAPRSAGAQGRIYDLGLEDSRISAASRAVSRTIGPAFLLWAGICHVLSGVGLRRAPRCMSPC